MSPSPISTILFTTDFSLRAKYGLLVAASLASQFKSKLIICHIHGPLSLKEILVSQNERNGVLNEKHFTQKELLHRSLKELGELEIFIRRLFSHLETRTEFRESTDIGASVNRIATKQQADLIVFSTKVREGDVVLGGKIIKSLKVEHPLLIIPIENRLLNEDPEQWRWQMKQIVYVGGISTGLGGSSSHSNAKLHEQSLRKLEQWKVHAHDRVKLKVLHMAYTSNDLDSLDQDVSLLKKEHPLVDDCIILQSNSESGALESLANYVRQNQQVSMLALTKKKKGFLASLLHKSVTKSVVNDVNIPVLIFHQ